MMADKQATPITIDDKEYTLEDMTDEQQMFVRHISDLERKISSAQFSVDQMRVGKDGFINLLKQSLEAKPEDIAAE
tara:strand:- start:32 stop:259 length:228 start_codon:yes stop_codon:yes gene_type:complete